MKTLSTEGAALLAEDRTQLWFGDMYTLYLASGTVLRWSAADIPLTWGGNTWELGPGLERTAIKWFLGLDLDETRVKILIHKNSYVIDGLTIRRALIRGMLDGARLIIDRGIARSGTGTIIAIVPSYFSGRVKRTDKIDDHFEILVRSPKEILDAPVPANVYEPNCSNRLFDSVCGIDPLGERVEGTVTGAIDESRLGFAFSTGATQADHRFQFGVCEFLTGDNAGRKFPIKESWTGNTLELVYPTPGEIQVGDTFYVFAGCDKKRSTCIGKFNNLANFKGFPFIPAAETTV